MKWNTARSTSRNCRNSCAAWSKPVRPAPVHKTPAVIVTLPISGTTDAVRANAWMIQQALAAGVHGILLCNAESPEAARLMIEAARYPFAPRVEGLAQGTRGNGSQAYASRIWGVTHRAQLPIRPGDLRSAKDNAALGHPGFQPGKCGTPASVVGLCRWCQMGQVTGAGSTRPRMNSCEFARPAGSMFHFIGDVIGLGGRHLCPLLIAAAAICACRLAVDDAAGARVLGISGRHRVGRLLTVLATGSIAVMEASSHAAFSA